jgi:hypothetical protein
MGFCGNNFRFNIRKYLDQMNFINAIPLCINIGVLIISVLHNNLH